MEENNNIETVSGSEQPMKKGNHFFIVLILLSICGLVGYVCYCKFYKKEAPKIASKEKQNEELYTISSLGSYELYEAFYDDEKGWVTEDESKLNKQDSNRDIQYITINYDTDSIKKFNKDSKENADSLLKIYQDLFNNPVQDGCTCVKYDNKYGCDSHLSSIDYKVYESSNYLLVKKEDNVATYCAGGESIATYYTISRVTKELLTNADILNEFGYNEESIKTKLRENIINYYYAVPCDEYTSDNNNNNRANLEKQIEEWIKDVNYFIYDDTLYLTCIDPPGSGNDYYIYNGTNVKRLNNLPFNK